MDHLGYIPYSLQRWNVCSKARCVMFFCVFRFCFFYPLNHLMEVFGNEFAFFNPYSARRDSMIPVSYFLQLVPAQKLLEGLLVD